METEVDIQLRIEKETVFVISGTTEVVILKIGADIPMRKCLFAASTVIVETTNADFSMSNQTHLQIPLLFYTGEACRTIPTKTKEDTSEKLREVRDQENKKR